MTLAHSPRKPLVGAMAKTEARRAPSLLGRAGPLLTLAALLLGIVLGVLSRGFPGSATDAILGAAQIVGGLWLNALKMTVIPLIVALLVTGIAAGAERARGGRIAAVSVVLFTIVYLATATLGLVGMPALLAAFPLDAAAAAALRSGLVAIDPGAAAAAPIPQIGDFFSNVVPANVVAAAGNGDVLQLVIFTVLFALAVSQIPAPQRLAILAFFEAVAAALLVLIGWVLMLAPLGVLALAFTLGAAAGGAALGALAHYVLLVSTLGVVVVISAYLVAWIGGRQSLPAFAKAMIGTQALAFSTRSSLACLPAMVRSAKALAIRERVIDVTLPLAVALFRATSPALNIGVAVYVGHWFGIEPHIGQILAALVVGAVIGFGSVSIPGEVSFITSVAPIAIALGVPVAPLALLVAVEMIPDIFRTVGNVTMDVAVTATADRVVGDQEATSA